MTNSEARWGIWIDVEGFSNLWTAGNLALCGLGRLTELIFTIGRQCYPSGADRLFAHQIGDGFYIASDFHEPSLDRCAALAVVLMRAMLDVGCVARASIAEGDLADYSGCRPRVVQAEAARNGETDLVSLGDGLMTLQAVMGQGLINAVTLDKLANTKGSLITVSTENARRLSEDFVTRPLAWAQDIVAIDWIHSKGARIEEIVAHTGLGSALPVELAARLDSYIATHRLSTTWSEPSRHYAGLSTSTSTGSTATQFG